MADRLPETLGLESPSTNVKKIPKSHLFKMAHRAGCHHNDLLRRLRAASFAIFVKDAGFDFSG